ncbi:MAG: hypothetical protein OXH75_26095 [Acidobacteria bacterium]|nr:hypothetical protein [Acidobacteriota bacterium]
MPHGRPWRASRSMPSESSGPKGRSLATALREAVVALDTADERITVAALRARRVAAVVGHD